MTDEDPGPEAPTPRRPTRYRTVSTPTPTRTALRVIATIATAALVAIAVSGGVIAYELHRQANAERESACYARAQARSGREAAVGALFGSPVTEKYLERAVGSMVRAFERCNP